MVADTNIFHPLVEHFGAILNSILLAAVGGLAKMINSRFKDVAEQQKATNEHLAVLNNRVHKVEQQSIDEVKLAETIQQSHAETRRQCQETNKREFDMLWRTMYREVIERKRGDKDDA